MCTKDHVDNDLLNTDRIRGFSEDYDQITCFGMNENPPDPESNVQTKKRGRKKQSMVQNLLDRFIGYKEDILLYVLLNENCNHEQFVESGSLSPSTVSWHLKKLEDAGIVGSVKERRFKSYNVRIEKE